MLQDLCVVDNFLAPAECGELLAAISSYRERLELPLIDRAKRRRSLRYRVIDGNAIATDLTQLEALHQRVGQMIGGWAGEVLLPLDERVAGINVNITPPGGEYRWHYDRNEVTAIVYLNDVRGGATEIYVHNRVVLPLHMQFLQRGIDAVAGNRAVLAVVGRRVVVTPRVGRLVVMRGDRCLHSVCAVEGVDERINVCLAYDRAGARRPARRLLDDYLYTERTISGGDPNYRSWPGE